MPKRCFWLNVRFPPFCVKTGLVITVCLNLVAKRRFWLKLSFASFCVKTGLVITVSLNIVPKRCFWLNVRFASFCVKTGLVITVSLNRVRKNHVFGSNCVLHHFVIKWVSNHCLSKCTAKRMIFV